jgi:flagellar hook assembly protein FlgD
MARPINPVISNMVVYPTPFTDNTSFIFDLGAPAEVKVNIYTLTGRLIRVLTKPYDENTWGYTKIDYNGLDNNNESISNGTYIYKIITRTLDNKTSEKTGKFTKIK